MYLKVKYLFSSKLLYSYANLQEMSVILKGLAFQIIDFKELFLYSLLKIWRF